MIIQKLFIKISFNMAYITYIKGEGQMTFENCI